jgi:DNA-binding NarL/FixJ family response regulator
VRLLIADDSALIRAGLTRLVLDAGHEIIGTAADADALATLIRGDRPDVAILDIRMPPTFTDEGARAAFELRTRWPDVGILLLSQQVVARYALRLMQKHPHGFGYLLKDRIVELDDLLDAITRVSRGGFAVDPDVVAHLMKRAQSGSIIERLSPREHDILALVAEGRSNKAISDRLRLSGKTVENHISNLFAKLDLIDDADEHRRIRAVLLYLEHSAPA